MRGGMRTAYCVLRTAYCVLQITSRAFIGFVASALSKKTGCFGAFCSLVLWKTIEGCYPLSQIFHFLVFLYGAHVDASPKVL